MLRRSSAVAGILLFPVLAGWGCGLPQPKVLALSPPEDEAPACPTADPGTIRVGVKYDVPQFGYYDRRRGTWEGFDVELAKEVATRLHKKLVLVPTATGDRLEKLDPALSDRFHPPDPPLSHECVDIVFSTLTITEERTRLIDLSRPYYAAKQTFLTRKGRHLSLETMGYQRICTTRDSTSAKHIRASGLPVYLREMERFSDCFELLRRPRPEIDAIMGDDVILLGYLTLDPHRFWLTGTFTSAGERGYGAGVKKDRPDGLLQTINEVLTTMEKRGKLPHVCHEWVGSLMDVSCESPPGVSSRARP